MKYLEILNYIYGANKIKDQGMEINGNKYYLLLIIFMDIFMEILMEIKYFQTQYKTIRTHINY